MVLPLAQKTLVNPHIFSFSVITRTTVHGGHTLVPSRIPLTFTTHLDFLNCLCRSCEVASDAAKTSGRWIRHLSCIRTTKAESLAFPDWSVKCKSSYSYKCLIILEILVSHNKSGVHFILQACNLTISYPVTELLQMFMKKWKNRMAVRQI